MIHITLLRHGQASISSDNYDQLSEMGRLQARKLGAYWACSDREFDWVFRGPLVRHRQTLAELIQGYASEGKAIPPAQALDGMTEHQAIAVMGRAIDKHQLAGMGSDYSIKKTRRDYFELFDLNMRKWIRQELKFDDLESWQQARIRVREVLAQLTTDTFADQKILAVTSGGFLAMAVGEVLQLADEQVYDLSVEIVNSAWVELRYSRGRAFLRSFNHYPHLRNKNEITLV